MYFWLHPLSLIPKSTFWMLCMTGKWSNSHTYQENIPYLWSGRLNKHKCLVYKLCLSVGVCPWLFLHSKKAIQLCCLLCLIFKIIFTFDTWEYFKPNTSQVVVYWATFTFTWVILFTTDWLRTFSTTVCFGHLFFIKCIWQGQSTVFL